MGVQLNLKVIGKVLTERVVEHMAAGYQIQPPFPLEEKAAGVGQAQLLAEGDDARTGQEDGFDHGRQINAAMPTPSVWKRTEKVADL